MQSSTNKLTLPLQVGKKYVNRTGEIHEVKATDPMYWHKDVVLFKQRGIWADTGKFTQKEENHDYDIIADFVEAPQTSKVTGHKHALLMLEYAKDALSNEKPWEDWEFRASGGSNWSSLTSHPDWYAATEYLRKARTVTINGFKCKAGVKDPAFDELYYLAAPSDTAFFCPLRYTDFYKHQADAGLLHVTKEDAITMAKAMLAFH